MRSDQRKLKRTLFPVMLTFFLDNFGLAMIYPIFTPLLIKSEYTILAGTTPLFKRTILLSFLIASFPLAQFFGAPLIGQFSDRLGRKRAFYVTILGTALGYTLTAISIQFDSLIGLFFSRFSTGLFAGNLTLCLATIADLSPDDTCRTRNFSLISVIGGLSFILAILFGGIFSNPNLSLHFNFSFPFWMIALLSYFNLVCMILFFHETHSPSRLLSFNPLKGFHNLLQTVQIKELRALYAVNFLFMLAWIASMQFLPAFLLEHFNFSMGPVSFCLMAVGAIWSLSNLILNRSLAKSFYPGQILLGSLLFVSFFLLLTGMTHSATSFLCLFFPSVCFAAICWTNNLATISLKAPSAIQGSILGINQSITSIAALLSPILGGLLFNLTPHAIYVFGGIIVLLACLILYHFKAYQQHSFH